MEEKTPSMGGNGDRVQQGRGVHAVLDPQANRCAHKVQLSGNGRGVGVHSGRVEATPAQVPMLRGGNGSPAHGNGVHQVHANLLTWFAALSARLRRVRVCCGDWSRVLKPSVTVGHGLTGVLLDPPYGVEDRDKVYNHDSLALAPAVRAWCAEHGSDARLRIALCGYDGEHNELEALGWNKVAWKAMGGYGNQNGTKNDNARRERIWFSPHCLQAGLFEG